MKLIYPYLVIFHPTSGTAVCNLTNCGTKEKKWWRKQAIQKFTNYDDAIAYRSLLQGGYNLLLRIWAWLIVFGKGLPR